MPDVAFEDLWFTAPDGLKLHALAAGPQAADRLPVVCLPGLARTAEDFRELMQALARAPKSRRVIALDSRGRGRSERDLKPENYSVPVELSDLVSVLAATGITRAVFVGTSRGGILTMMLALARPEAIAGAVLNDIGPVIETAGLLRIKEYVGRMPRPRSWSEAVTIMRTAVGGHPGLDEEGWQWLARRTWVETAHGLEPACDPALSKSLEAFDPMKPPPPLWHAFDALPNVPLLVLRGEHSDLLSRTTVLEMQRRRPALAVAEVKGQGHAPLLRDAATIGPILALVARCDAAESLPGSLSPQAGRGVG
jgi:pimeloyl-ACP methyl ester carboxylesterase